MRGLPVGAGIVGNPGYFPLRDGRPPCRGRARGVREPLRTLLGAVCLLAALLSPSAAVAHELKLDRLALFPDPDSGYLRGQFTLDPELTRALDDEPTVEQGRRLLALIQSGVVLRVDGQPLEMRLGLRELWRPNGAVSGDIVMLSSSLPVKGRRLSVELGDFVSALALSIQLASGGVRAAGTSSILLLSGERSPPYPLRRGEAESKLDSGWRPGNAEQFAQAVASSSRDGAAAPSGAIGGAPMTDPTADGGGATGRARGKQAEVPLSATLTDLDSEEAFRLSFWETAFRYGKLGFLHVIPWGWDHLLFVLGVVLGTSRSLRRLLVSLSLFTVGHTVALAWGALGWRLLPATVVEPLIALSVAYLGFEQLLAYQRGEAARSAAKGLSSGWRSLVLLAFGLLHGQGFAGALLEVGFPRDALALPLLSFNLGVELAQICGSSVGTVILSRGRVFRNMARVGTSEDVPSSLERVVAWALLAIGLVWTVERLWMGA